MWKSDFHMAHVEILFLFTSATDDFTNFLKMYGNLSMAIAYTNSYRNRNRQHIVTITNHYLAPYIFVPSSVPAVIELHTSFGMTW